jgi:cardiolipin synthase A/B
VPGGSDAPIVRTFSRAGYRPLLEAGVRIFEWNGSMLHAKTAVADGKWARVGSTNLNIASWLGNRELDVIIENGRIAHQMEEMFLADLTNTTEVVLNVRNRVRAPGAPRRRQRIKGSGSGGRIVAGAVRISNTVTAALANRRRLEPIEAHIALAAGVILAGVSVLIAVFPRSFAYPAAVVTAWIGAALVWRSVLLYRRRKRRSQL